MSQSPYSLLREVAKRTKFTSGDYFSQKYIWKHVGEKRQELMLQKGPIVISSQPVSRNSIKKHDVKEYMRHVLKQRWDVQAKPQKIFKIEKPKKKAQKLKLKEKKLLRKIKESNFSSPMVFESAFDILHKPERCQVPDVLIEDLFPDQVMQREQCQFKVQDCMPYLSVLEKNCQFFVTF